MERAGRQMPVGAELLADGVHFRTWAPDHARVALLVEGRASRAMAREDGGYFSLHVPGLDVGALYRFRLDDGPPRPDPASRCQPEGPHGPSMVVDPGAFRWTDSDWRGLALEGQVLYELHVGTFTAEGTFRAATDGLVRLADLGISVVELMPVACFDGLFGWGYDGVDLFAPHPEYGTPDDLRRFVDRAHALGIGIVLDVVYNHFGPSGNYAGDFARAWFSSRYRNEWGDPLNFDGPGAAAVRAFFVANAAYWIREFHMDGLRLDATQQIFDSSPVSILAEITRAVRDAAPGRGTLVVAENEPQEVRLLADEEAGGFAMDMVWNDDFHHAARVALTRRSEAYFTDYRGSPQELVSALRHGWLYQGQHYSWQKKQRGSPTRGLEPCRFVTFLENHDQVANSAHGLRLAALAAPGALRAMTALLLLGPGTPMLFQGQEYGSSAPFLYFADHKGDLARAVAAGRRAFLAQFPGLSRPEDQRIIADPADPETFRISCLDPSAAAQPPHSWWLALHRDLIALRRAHSAFGRQCAAGMDGVVVGSDALALRLGIGDPPEEERLLLVNLGADLSLSPAPDPLLAPPPGMAWDVLWTSEAHHYGGTGLGSTDTQAGWRLPGLSAMAFAPVHRLPGEGAEDRS